MKRILGIQKDHNSSACLFIGNELVYYNQEERVSRIKGDSGLPVNTLSEICKITPEIDVLLISGYDSIPTENLSIISMIRKLGFKLSKTFEFKPYYKGHHLFHAAKAFYSSTFENALVVVSDGKGSTYNLTNGDQAFETTSVFSVSYPDQFKLLYRRFFTHSDDYDQVSVVWDNALSLSKIPTPQYLSKKTETEIRNDFDLGFMYEGTARSLGFTDAGGKMMSLQSFGHIDETVPPVLTENSKFNMDVFRFDEFKKHRGFDTLKYPVLDSDEKKVNFARHIQLQFEDSGLELIQRYLEKTQHKNLILTGGTALNVVANSHFRKNLPDDINMYVEPLCGDEGNCIGICQLYIHEKYKSTEVKKPISIYLGGNTPSYDYILRDNETEIKNTTPAIVAELLKAGHIVGLFQGKSEGGPRALGNRSLLFDPRVENGKDVVNLIKGRELFRPFAAAVMLDHAGDWFELDKIKESPFMMYAVKIKDDKIESIPAVKHIDNTCRIQTVTPLENKNLYDIVQEFNNKTGIPMILNTSFNLAGDAIVETVEDAIDTLRRSNIEYLYLPEIEKIIYVPNKR